MHDDAKPNAMPPSVDHTTPPASGRAVVLYDGACAFCMKTVSRLRRWVPSDAFDWRSIHDRGALDPFTGLSMRACLAAMHVVGEGGAVVSGAGAMAAILERVVAIGWIARAYRLPGIRWICDWSYARVARRRYLISGRVCGGDGVCSIDAVEADVEDIEAGQRHHVG